MKVTTHPAFLVVVLTLFLLQEAATQTVRVTLGEFDSKVFIEWSGSFTALPTTLFNTAMNARLGLVSNTLFIYLIGNPDYSSK